MLNTSKSLRIKINTTGCAGTSQAINYLEHVRVVITLVHLRRGAVSITLTSPSGTSSNILGPRKSDEKKGSFKEFAFMSTHFWGENPNGVWSLEFKSKCRVLCVYDKDMIAF